MSRPLEQVQVQVGRESPPYARARLFLVSSVALTMAGIGASVRANTAADLQRIFLDPIDAMRSAEMIATVLGLPFLRSYCLAESAHRSFSGGGLSLASRMPDVELRIPDRGQVASL